MFADPAMWVQSATRLLGLKVLKFKGSENPADIRTKPHTAEMHEQLCRQVGLWRLGGDLGAVREVEVNAVIEKMGRMNHEAQPRGKTLSSLTLSAAISAVCLAIQAQQVEAAGELNPVPEVSVEKDYSYMVMITLLFISWLGMFLLGCAVGYGHGKTVGYDHGRSSRREDVAPLLKLAKEALDRDEAERAGARRRRDKCGQDFAFYLDDIRVPVDVPNDTPPIEEREEGAIHLDRWCPSLGIVHESYYCLRRHAICKDCAFKMLGGL